MENPLFKKLYTNQELQHKIEDYIEKYKQVRTENDYRSAASVCYDLGRLYEILKDKEKSRFYYQKVVDEWNAHPDKVTDHLCVSALRALNKPKKALEVVFLHPQKWMLVVLALLYEERGRKKEAQLIYAGLSYYSYQLSEVRYSFWRPHYLQEASDIWTRIESPDYALKYNQKAVAAWEEIKDNIQRSLALIEEAWLYEEVGYIYEKAGEFETAMDFYQKAQSKYQKAYTKEPTAVGAHQIDGDWNRYFKFFIYQIPDFGFIHFRCEHPGDNDYRRIKYRILNLEEQMNV